MGCDLRGDQTFAEQIVSAITCLNVYSTMTSDLVDGI